MSRYRLHRQGDRCVILSENRSFAAGTIKFVVRDYNGEEIAAVGSLREAATVLADHLSANPSKWEQHGSERYARLTHEYFDDLMVEQDQDGSWVAFRNGRPLSNQDGFATFSTATAAKHAADLHAHDGHLDANCAGDGLSWLAPGDSPKEDEEWCLIEDFLGETMAEAAEAIARAHKEYSSRAIQPGTVQTIRAALRRLCGIHEASLFGSYDAVKHSRDPYFVLISSDGRSGTSLRISFEEAANHYGKIALRGRLGPNVSDKEVRKMISEVLKQMPAANLISRAA